MTIAELHAKIEAALNEAEVFEESEQFAHFAHFGIRFEDAARAVGDTLPGTSAWYVDDSGGGASPNAWWRRCYAIDNCGNINVASPDDFVAPRQHCYLIAGDRHATPATCGPDEIVICNAVVLAVIF